MKMIIETADNGYIVKTPSSEPEINDEITVFETDGDTNSALSRLLYHIAENAGGYYYDKFGSQNLDITFDKKGHKVEDNDDIDAMIEEGEDFQMYANL